ncbi:MAG: zinc metalloprotease HtpX [Candidatus Diapherotrites archaeon]|nr:zinc metalloprotease HtpX [Candidatus Diapherotrites archaeon]MDZ4256126.1 zinc metalloprotease HtpX [archaeon]
MALEWARTVFFLGLLTGLLIVIGNILGGTEGMIVAFIFAAVMNFVSYFFSDKIVLAMYRAKPVETTTTQGARIERLVTRAAGKMNIPMPRLYMVESKSPNAFATGRGPKHAAVAFTGGILDLLDDEELEGVIAHELSHVKNRDVLISSIAATIAGAIGMLAFMLQFAAFGSRNGEGRNPIGLLLMAIVVPIIATLIQLAVSRSREYHADETAAHTLSNGKGLARALGKLERGIHHHPMRSANQGTAHLFIANPFSGKALLGLLATHPPMDDRIARLEKMTFDKR